MPRRAAVVLAVVATAAAAGLTALPASADTPPPPSDAAALIGRLAPDLLTETSPPVSADRAAAIAREQGGRPFRLAFSGDGASPLIELTPPETDGAGLPVAIRIDDARGQGAADASGLTTFAVDGSAAAYVQPLSNGVRMLTALTGPDSGDSFSYTLDLPDGTTRTELPDGETLLADSDHHYVVTLAAAWARDASGRSVPTHYEWSGDTLTQHVDLDPGTAYPVLLDPNWYYSYDFSAALPLYSARYPKATEFAADRLLHGCFNCYFPINGAPWKYPSDGDVLRLNASPYSLELTAAPVRVQTANGGAMQFVAMPGHFDGQGSMITFSWYNDPSGYLHLYVHAMVKRDLGPALNIANSRIAGANWMLYWQRVADNASGPSGGGV